MSVAQYFQDFCYQLPVPTDTRSSIASRTATITRRLNTDFRNTTSDTANRFYGGSYGRNTAVGSLSDIDLLYVLPYETYAQFNAYSGNKQSSLLQAVRLSLNMTYPNSAVIADGQIVKIGFRDGITYEIVPVFLNANDSYTHADSNDGGSWKTCWPKHEIDAFATRDRNCNGNLIILGRMARAWRDYNSVPMGGMLIDTLAYQFLETWEHRQKSYLYYDYLTRDFFGFLAGQDGQQNYWRAPGSGSYVWRGGNFEYKARQAQLRALEALDHLSKNQDWSAKQKFREIYGTAFPS
ncbi:hypothetical protein GALL_203680 [mine drainage metagenome]|uniref:Nucleotidyltransferase n=1 Tax=mine drainage metagenome TaxID=410659 RepID=A0A1J5RPD8_9ZZZZ